MSFTIGINGFGRIGKMILRAIYNRGLLGKEIDVKVIVDKYLDSNYFAYQMNYDSVHGNFNKNHNHNKYFHGRMNSNIIEIDGYAIECLKAKDNIIDSQWSALGINCVIESTGYFTKTSQLRKHILKGGANSVILTAPYDKDDDIEDKITIIMGVNHEKYDVNVHKIISCASCTSNCIMPIIYALKKKYINILNGTVVLVHAYTSTQNIIDGFHSKNWRLGRAAGCNIIPTTTGFKKIISEIFPDMESKIVGLSLRVPIVDVSAMNFTFTVEKITSIEVIDNILKNATMTYLKDILTYTEERLVSSDFINNSYSSIYDSVTTLDNNLNNNNLFNIFAWYDNEWGYANRVVDLIMLMIKNNN